MNQLVHTVSHQVQSSVLLITGYGTHKKMYKASKSLRTPHHLTDTPCGVCPVMSQCCEGGIVSPAGCPYMTAWLDSQMEGTAESSTANTNALYSW